MFSGATDLADPFRHLLQVVKDALGGERRRGLFSGPAALLTWMRTRRERKEQEEALQQFKALLEAFLALLADFRAEKPVAEMTPPVAEGKPQADLPRPRQSGASWQRIVKDWPLLRFSALYAVGRVGQGHPSLRPSSPTSGEGEDTSPRPSPQSGEGEGAPARATARDASPGPASPGGVDVCPPFAAALGRPAACAARAGPVRHGANCKNRC